MPELVEKTAEPQLGQKLRLTIFPLSAGLSKLETSPLSVIASKGTPICEQCAVPLLLRQSTQ